MRQKKVITAEICNRYTKATKKGKSKILDEFSATTEYNRTYAARILRLSSGKVSGYSKTGSLLQNPELIRKIITVLHKQKNYLSCKKGCWISQI